MEESVKENVEETTLEESQTSEEQTTNDSLSDVEDPSGEDVKTDSTEDEDEVVAGANAQVKSEKGRNRVQELANREKEALERSRQLEEANRQLMEQLQGGYPQQQKPEAQTNGYPNQYDPNTFSIQMLMEKQRLFEEKQAFDKAEREFPELQPGSPNYNRDFDDAVYAMVKSQGLSPVDAAKRVSKLISLGASRAVSTQAKSEAQKAKGSVGVQSRSEGIDNSDNDTQEARNRAVESGSLEDVANFLRRIG
jgi:hypothetical protein